MNLVPRNPNSQLVIESEVPRLLQSIRPAWQAKRLITRVQQLVEVDPSSACQRLFNAAIHDLREKVVVAGLDIAAEAAKQYKLPPVATDEDVENYSTSRLIDLVYRMGLLTRPEWRRLMRCYEIRRDLEHEDDEYEAGVEDCVYIFKTCIDHVLSKDPLHLLRVTDVKEIVEKPEPAVASEALVEEFSHAPRARQVEILGFLLAVVLDRDESDIVQQNAFAVIKSLQSNVEDPVKLTLAESIQRKQGREELTPRIVRVSIAIGAFPYLRQNQIRDFYTQEIAQLTRVGTNWGAHASHGELLRNFREIGGLLHMPNDMRQEALKWLVLTYIGTRGGVTSYGNTRNVFYSNTAAPIIEQLISESIGLVATDLANMREDDDIARAISNQHISRRFDRLLDIVDVN